MIFSSFLELVKKSFNTRAELFEKKTHDYATEDCLSNFKRMSQLCSLLRVNVGTSEGVALFYILIKLDRLCNLLQKGVGPKNESLDDTINDLQNYLDLLRGLLEEDK